MAGKTLPLLAKATAMTRQGRLLEATRLIQKALTKPLAAASTASAPRPHKAATLGKIASRLAWPTAARREPATAAPVKAAPAASRASATAGYFATHSHAQDDLTRQYKLFVPASAKRAPALVVMLHGCTQDADDFAVGTAMNEVAERDGFLVLYPQQSRDANPSACWNWFNRRDQQRDSGEAAFLAGLIRSTAKAHGVDPDRIYIAGLSAGGAMAAIVASEYPELIAAAGIHSGLPAGAAANLPDALTAMRSGGGRKVTAAHAAAHGAGGLRAVPTIVFHGDADRTVHANNGEQIVASVLDRSGGATTARSTNAPTAATTGRFTRTDHVDATGKALVEHWVLHGAGHAWAGGDARGSYVDPQGVDATGEMVRFFSEHPKSR